MQEIFQNRHRIKFARQETREEVLYLQEVQDLIHFKLESTYGGNNTKLFFLKFWFKEGSVKPRALCLYEKQGKELRDFLTSQNCALTL